jgi:hypothetical protein
MVLVLVTTLFLAGCGTSAESARVRTAEGSAHGSTTSEANVADPSARAEAGGWGRGSLEAPPHYCNDEGGTEWCEGERDDDCDGVIDEGCADCVNEACVRFAITGEEMRRGTGRTEAGECVGPVYCGRIDGFASTEPLGGCGDFHCGTLVYGDSTARPHHCTIAGRCVDGEFRPSRFSW